MSGNLKALEPAQLAAVDPVDSVWLSASAGTGKTQVLAARVLRLLLRPDTHPADLLCLTFTKAGATEMAVRVNEVLARWVRLSQTQLARELLLIGADVDPATLNRARSLFASVLDAPGGGLRIDTIHAFAQYLLGSFPEEAGLTAGARVMDDRERARLLQQVMSDMLVAAENGADSDLVAAVENLSCRLGPSGAQKWLLDCADAADIWSGAGAWTPPFRERVLRLLKLPPDAGAETAARLCADAAFPVDAMRRVAARLGGAGGKKAQTGAAFAQDWLDADAAERLERLGGFLSTLLRKDGKPLIFGKNLTDDATFTSDLEQISAAVDAIKAHLHLVEAAGIVEEALLAGRRFALLWHEAKQRDGLLDFDDQIRRAARLLTSETASRWIQYKLDRRFDHILIDEAQDTNAEQWSIIGALIDDFFDGLAAHDGKVRTIFTVGDYKQAIFGFQGTSPRNFEVARHRIDRDMAEAAEAAAVLRGGPVPRRLKDVDLGRSYRSTAPILSFVDEVIAAIGHERLGLNAPPPPHIGAEEPGMVTLWPPVSAAPRDDDGEPDVNDGGATEEPDGPEAWLGRHDRIFADALARQVAAWMRDGFALARGGTVRNARPGDVMVLLRKRADLAGLIVARLHAHGVPVAGVDRLRLGSPLAVKDLIAALSFAVQPLDDLNLAALLVSPLMEWSQQDLLDHGYRDEGVPLWTHLRRSAHPLVVDTVSRLQELLARADFQSPLDLLHWILVGPFQSRARLLARLGREAEDPVGELLNAAESYAASHIVSLQGFLDWFSGSTEELKREADEGGDRVRVMTVHASKGLQAPIVILADATVMPRPDEKLVLSERLPGSDRVLEVPIPNLPSSHVVGPLLDARQAAEAVAMEEHWRLLYVALTRAEEALFIGGALGKRARGQVHPDSWYGRLQPLFPDDAVDDPIWGERRERGEPAPKPPADGQPAPRRERLSLPSWAAVPVGPEPRPPRPLAPSAPQDGSVPEPPSPAAARTAARRGVLIHRLLERYDPTSPEPPERLMARWLERQAADFDADERSDVLGHVLSVVDHPALRDVFGPEALAEVPFTALVGDRVVNGTVDRLLVLPDRVKVVDFKTTRSPPATVEEVPLVTLRQMAAYEAAMERIYPERAVETVLVYSHVPIVLPLPSHVLRPHRAGDAQEQAAT
ncbi:double-strand break repair helicase AddA [Erythrobacteraceae bacterium CFH 75059]|uniref:double-strand break repair helicase AddA n=1 Tax=Qipengyuania thermophila TaxID=2509361 RepID=UPI0010208BE8|nr:double-strand break repair helicase AddA [Qipengyuania thermophila]TCD05056.1 double-strand break repair helicase AddA [Erythrobacteraceae bacterium CFH 75059]